VEGGAHGVAPRARPGEDRLHFHQHTPQELAHYARAAFDIQFDFGGTLGFQEIEGVHHRGDFDLGRHQEYSGKKLEYYDQVGQPPLRAVRRSRRAWAPTA
jgi:glycyl-tRNA synthetase (class II)